MQHEFTALRLRGLLFSLLFCLYACSPAQQRERPVSIIPRPAELVRNAGSFRLTKSTMLITSSTDRKPHQNKKWCKISWQLRIVSQPAFTG